MQIIRNISEALPEACVATIGFFDGVHMGHRFLIDAPGGSPFPSR